MTSDQWQPIETAPRDGTEVLVYFDSASVPIVHVAWYRGPEEWEESGQYCEGFRSLAYWEGWWTYPQHSVTQEKLTGYRTPTHWQPFEPPTDRSER